MNIENLFENEFNSKLTSLLTTEIFKATTAFNTLIKNNFSFFSYPLYSSVKGDLLSYSIEHCLHDAIFTNPNLNCNAYTQKVNNFNRSILHITTEHFLLTIAKTNKWNQLPCSSKYKLKYAKYNNESDGQYCFNFINNTIIKPPFYVLLTYGYDPIIQSCNHIDLLIPDVTFKKFTHRKDILSIQKNFITIPTSDVEETVAKLKPEFEKKILQLDVGE